MSDKLTKLRADYDSLLSSVRAATKGTGALNAHELRVQLDTVRRFLAATEEALAIVVADYVKVCREYDKGKGLRHERATYWMNSTVLSNPIAYEAIKKAERKR